MIYEITYIDTVGLFADDADYIAILKIKGAEVCKHTYNTPDHIKPEDYIYPSVPVAIQFQAICFQWVTDEKIEKEDIEVVVPYSSGQQRILIQEVT